MKLKIDRALYQCTFAEEAVFDDTKYKVLYRSVTYIFDPYSFIVLRSDTEEAKEVENAVVFAAVSDTEAQRAFVASLNNRRLARAFGNLDDNAFSNKFWQYFDDGGQKLSDYRSFEEYYRIKRIADWCEENYIPYYLDRSDKLTDRVMKYAEAHNLRVGDK